MDAQRFDPAALMAEAQEETGLSDWGDEAFREPLSILCESLETEAGLNARGRDRLRRRLVGDLAQRLGVVADRTREPAIAQVALPAPIIVTGNGRSGTTLMHKLLALDPAHRPVLLWETRRPSPPPEAAHWLDDPRIEEIERELADDGYKQPDAMARHHFGADQPEECSTTLALACVGGIYGAMARTPTYTAYRETADFHAAYGFHRSVLQALMFRGRGGRLVLKAPEHMFHLPELLATYPDAVVVQMHRDPARVIPSLISIVAKMQSFYADEVDVAAIRRMRMGYSDIMNRLPAIRAGLDRPGRFFDMQYLDLEEDQIGAVRGLYAAMGLAFTGAYQARLEGFIARNPRNRFGAHAYSLADYDLTLADIDRAFGPYIEANGVRLERR